VSTCGRTKFAPTGNTRRLEKNWRDAEDSVPYRRVKHERPYRRRRASPTGREARKMEQKQKRLKHKA
jgi:hypothetical protein